MGRASFAAKETFSKIDASSDTSGDVQQLKIFLEGVKMTEKQLSEVLKKLGLEKYNPTAEEFDPNRHNTVFQVPSSSKPVDHVAVVLKVRLSVKVPAAVCDDRRVLKELMKTAHDGCKNLKIVVYIDKEIVAVIAAKQEIQYRLKAFIALRIVNDRRLELGDVAILDISAATIEQDESTPKSIPSAESKEFQFDTEHGGRVLPNFLNSITGMKCGETESFPYVFPDSWKQEIFVEFVLNSRIQGTVLQRFT